MIGAPAWPALRSARKSAEIKPRGSKSSVRQSEGSMFVPPCLPTPSKRARSGPEWVHEIKHDGYRLIVRRDGNRVRLYTRRGYNWSHRFPLIAAAVKRLKVRSAMIDGEAIVPGEDGRSDFDKLHSGGYDEHVVLYGFDLIEVDGDDLRSRPLEERKARLAKLLKRMNGGIYLSEHLDGDGSVVFEHACRLGLEGIVSKRRDLPYRSGRSKCWIKVKNPASPAMLRVHEGPWW
jgi:bifunctional non-homologous end joining protein LigD